MNFHMKYEHALFPKGEFNEELLEWVSYLVAFFKVLVSCSSTFEHPYHPLTLLWWEGGWVGGRVFPPMLALFLIREFYSP